MRCNRRLSDPGRPRFTRIRPASGRCERAAISRAAPCGWSPSTCVGDENGARWMLARSKGYLVFDWIGHLREHWAQRHVRFPARRAACTSRRPREQVRTALEGNWVWPDVILCEAVRIRVGAGRGRDRRRGVYTGAPWRPGDTGTPAGALSSFTDEHGGSSMPIATPTVTRWPTSSVACARSTRCRNARLVAAGPAAGQGLATSRQGSSS